MPTPEPDLAALMPHQPPMLLIRRVIRAERDGGEAEALFPNGGLFATPEGLVDEAVHFELIAQTFAACTAVWKARTGGDGEPEAGYLASLRSMEIHAPARAGEPLMVRAGVSGRVEDFFIVEGEVNQGGCRVASGQVTILVPGGASS